MKKALVVLMLFACVGVLAFADGAPAVGEFHAWDRGTFYPVVQVGSYPAMTAWGPQWDNMGIDQEWSFSYDSKPDKSGDSYGFSATDEFGGTQLMQGTTSGATWFNTYYNFGSIARVEFGVPRNYDYSVGGQAEPYGGWETSNWEMIECNTDGLAFLTVGPFSGLKVALGMYAGSSLPQVFTPPSATGGTTGNGAYSNNGTGGFANNFVIAASYAIPKVATINAFYKAEETSNYNNGNAAINAGDELKALDINATITAIPNWSFVAMYAGEFQNSSNPVTRVLLSAKGTQGALTDALDLALAMDSSVTAFAAELSLEYILQGPYGVGALIGYDNAEGVNWFEGGYGGYAGFMINPFFEVNFDNGSRVRVGILYASGVSSPSVDSTGQLGAAFASQTQAVFGIPIDYVWSF